MAYYFAMRTADAISHFKTASALARSLRITPQAITSWGELVPKVRQYELERITNGKLKADWPVAAK